MKPKFVYGEKVYYLESTGEIFTGWIEDHFPVTAPDNDAEIISFSYIFKRDIDSQMKVVNQTRIWNDNKIKATIDHMCDL